MNEHRVGRFEKKRTVTQPLEQFLAVRRLKNLSDGVAAMQLACTGGNG